MDSFKNIPTKTNSDRVEAIFKKLRRNKIKSPQNTLNTTTIDSAEKSKADHEHTIIVNEPIKNKAAFHRVYALNANVTDEWLKKYSWKDIFQDKHVKDSSIISNSNVLSQSRSYPTPNTSNIPVVTTSNNRTGTKTNVNFEYDSENEQSSSKSPGNESLPPNFFGQEYINHFSITLISRIESLWKELCIPVLDKQYYRNCLFKDSTASFEKCNELSNYLHSLLKHRKLTLSVLQSIARRNQAVNSLLRFVQEKFEENEKSDEICESVLSIPVRKPINISSDKTPNVSINVLNDVDSRLLHDLVQCLFRLQLATVQVILRIIAWRENCWRPLPFIWKNENYLTGIYRIDCDLILQTLRSYHYKDHIIDNQLRDSNTRHGVSLLDIMSPAYRYFPLIFCACNDTMKEILNRGCKLDNDLSHHVITVINQVYRKLTTVSRSDGKTNINEKEVKDTDDNDNVGDVHSSRKQLLDEKTMNIVLKVMYKEEKVQLALAEEREKLTMQGDFIPTLR